MGCLCKIPRHSIIIFLRQVKFVLFKRNIIGCPTLKEITEKHGHLLDQERIIGNLHTKNAAQVFQSSIYKLEIYLLRVSKTFSNWETTPQKSPSV